MMKNVLEYLENTKERLPDKAAFVNDDISLSFTDVYERARSAGSFLSLKGIYRKPVVVFMKKGPETLTAFFGCLYAGCPYVPVDEEMPEYRIKLIMQTLEPEALICDESTFAAAAGFAVSEKIFLYEDMIKTPADEELLLKIRACQIDLDPAYVVFTSGSTGIPKGVVASHRCLIDYIDNISEALGFDESCIFGNQAPFYIDAYMREVGATLKFGATTVMIPKQLFMFPVKLIEYVNKYNVNTLCWAVSALTMVSTFNTFKTIVPSQVRTVTFVGEVFPVKQLNIWMDALPDARFFNLYGPTEITGVCCCYEVKRRFSENETVPAGKPFNNTRILLINDEGKAAKEGEAGEICVSGSCLSLGYYGNFEKTSQAFTQNPLNDKYTEMIYHTGDMGRLDENGDIIFMSRRDLQIKHMGHRIELGEIEACVYALDGIWRCCCLFDSEKKKIILYFAGSVSEADVAEHIKASLPRYMFANYIKKLDELPLTPNGKTDRTALKQMYDNKQEKI